MNFATVHETCNWGGEGGPPRGGGARKSGGKARGPALFPKLVEPRQWNRALRFQFDMCIVIEDAKAPSHCPPGLVTSHGIINCLGVCIYIYICSSMSLSRICGVVLLRAGSPPSLFSQL